MVDKISYITKEQFEQNKELKAQYGSYEKFQLAQLKLQSIHTFAQANPINVNSSSDTFFNMRLEAYDKHLAESDALIANYKQLEAQYEALLEQQNAINKSLMSKYHVSNKTDLLDSMKEKNSRVDKGLYNKTANSVSEAYSNFISALQTANYQTHRIV